MILARGGDAPDALRCLFVISNVISAFAYATVAVAAIRFVRLARTRRSRWAVLFAAGFFTGCVGTHLLILRVGELNPFWVAWHVTLAVCTVGGVVVGALILRDAHRLWQAWARESEQAKRAATRPGDRDDDATQP